MNDTDLRYPVGPEPQEAPLDAFRRAELIDSLDELPSRLAALADGFDPRAWDLSYREGGWTARQVIHHLADSHLNAYARFRLALTEETPTVKPYDQDAWAALPDVLSTPAQVSVGLLEGLHRRWVDLLRSLPEEAFRRSLYHPERGRRLTLDELLQSYAWHGHHHLAHLELVRRRATEHAGPLAAAKEESP